MPGHVFVHVESLIGLLTAPHFNNILLHNDEHFVVQIRATPTHASKLPDILSDISPTNTIFFKHLIRNCCSETKQLLSLKYFSTYLFLSKLFHKYHRCSHQLSRYPGMNGLITIKVIYEITLDCKLKVQYPCLVCSMSSINLYVPNKGGGGGDCETELHT